MAQELSEDKKQELFEEWLDSCSVEEVLNNVSTRTESNLHKDFQNSRSYQDAFEGWVDDARNDLSPNDFETKPWLEF